MFRLLVVIALLPVGLTVPFYDVSRPRVATKNGPVVGRYVRSRGGRNAAAFLGIPFAKPPVGNLRFQSPVPAEPWTNDRLATRHASPCVQILHPRGSEDCLYLDVYTPNVTSRNLLPVIVFIYGGAFEIGSADAYTPEYLMDHDIVYVALQYRLGLFGFLSTGDEVVPGNMWLKDQRLALRWVKDNIKFFGGDPDKVTIFGESAGAVSVHYHMMFNSQEGLFRAGISHSGSALVPWSFRPPLEVAKMVDMLSRLSGCPSDSTGFVKCLRAMPALRLMLLYDLKYKHLMYVGTQVFALEVLPMLGAVLEPDCVKDRIVTDNPWRRKTTLPWLTGVNSKETLFVFLAPILDRTNMAFRLLDAAFDTFFPMGMNYQNSNASGDGVCLAIRDFYLQQQPISRSVLGSFINVMSDTLFTYGTYESVLRSSREKTYVFLFDYLGANTLFPLPSAQRLGAIHTDELFLFFPHPANPVPVRLFDTPADRNLSDQLITMWVNFATHLDPTPGSASKLKWPPFSSKQSFLHIKQDGLKVDTSFLPQRMAFWKSQPFPFRDDYYSGVRCSKTREGPNSNASSWG